MINVPIPAWNLACVIPPLNESRPTNPERSPYSVSLTEFVCQFGFSESRRIILDGFLRYRTALHTAGIVNGFQWVDGSFAEHIELLDARSPNDIDVVTFFELPKGKSQLDLAKSAPEVFPITIDEQQSIKDMFYVDAYLEHLGKAPARLVKQSAYWYSMWSHRRNQDWKGYLQLDLAPTEDKDALVALAKMTSQGENCEPQ
jgi:hypothetical protein